jgi:hypothetical protein
MIMNDDGVQDLKQFIASEVIVRLDKIEERIDTVDRKVDKLSESVTEATESQFTNHNERIERLEQKAA